MSGGSAGGCVEAAHGGVWAVLWSALFLFITWLAGQITGRMGLPPLAGEIIAGMVRACAHVQALLRALPRRSLRHTAFAACPQLLGPNLADLVPESAALKLFGEFGLYLMCVLAHCASSQRCARC
jgi:Kef-type K+ transport system membrane component KefB